jgi:hypothetical protein
LWNNGGAVMPPRTLCNYFTILRERLTNLSRSHYVPAPVAKLLRIALDPSIGLGHPAVPDQRSGLDILRMPLLISRACRRVLFKLLRTFQRVLAFVLDGPFIVRAKFAILSLVRRVYAPFLGAFTSASSYSVAPASVSAQLTPFERYVSSQGLTANQQTFVRLFGADRFVALFNTFYVPRSSVWTCETPACGYKLPPSTPLFLLKRFIISHKRVVAMWVGIMLASPFVCGNTLALLIIINLFWWLVSSVDRTIHWARCKPVTTTLRPGKVAGSISSLNNPLRVSALRKLLVTPFKRLAAYCQSGVNHAVWKVLEVVLSPWSWACVAGGTMLTLAASENAAARKMWEKTRYVLSVFLFHASRPPRYPPSVLRNVFNDTPLVEHPPVKGHTHAKSAASRSTASLLADRMQLTSGLTPYYYQRSMSDIRHRRPGSRMYFWSKDLTQEPADDPSSDDDMLVLVDVDQYVPMSEFLNEHFKPTMLYTFQPTRVASQAEDYAYTFDSDNQVHYYVTGGAEYVHQVWNYSVESFTCVKTFLGFPVAASHWLVDRRVVSPDHEVVLLTPMTYWPWWCAWATYFVSGNTLERLEPVVDDFLRLRVHTRQGMFVSTGKPESFAAAFCPSDVDDALGALSRINKVELQVPQVQSYLDGDKVGAPILTEYHRKAVGSKPPYVAPSDRQSGVRSFQYRPDSYDPDAKASLVAFMRPIIDGCFAPSDCLNNDIQAVEARVLNIQTPELIMTPFMLHCMREFVTQLIPVPHLLDPADLDEVYERQNRPSQRWILDAAVGVLPKRFIRMFVKHEAYGEPKDPRCISQINGTDKRDWSMFMYPLARILKDTHWYAFGKSPVDVAHRVSEICSGARVAAVMSDFSRMDGRVSNLLRELELAVMLRAYRPVYHGQIVDLARSQYNLKAVTKHGHKYATACQRASGSPETSCFNSIDNAFIAFLAFRRSIVGGRHLDASAAYARLGMYGGDDGITADVDVAKLEAAAKEVGQVLTGESVPRGYFGVNFLARIYGPHVWSGDPNSCCDIRRQLTKFHTTVHLPGNVSPEEKLLEKSRSYYLTDACTPVLGHLVAKVIELVGPISMTEKTRDMRAWNSDLDISVQYPNEDSGWMQDYVAMAMPDFDFKAFFDHLETVRSIEDVLQFPLCEDVAPAKTASPVVVGDMIVLPPPKDSEKKFVPKRRGKRSRAETKARGGPRPKGQ